jgi:transcriptional regulator with XRE-family HTH domain
MNRSTFSKNLKQARKLKGLSQEEAAAKIYRSQQAWAKYETGEAEPCHATLLMICDALDILDLLRFLSMPDYFAGLQQKVVNKDINEL